MFNYLTAPDRAVGYQLVIKKQKLKTMNKLIYFAAGLVAMVLAGSCQEIDYLDGNTGVKFQVTAGDVVTKAIADGTNIDVLYWELYGADPVSASSPLGEGVVRDNDGDKTFTVELKLVADQDYNIVFWAQVDGQNHYVVDDLRNIQINTYADEKANDETRAAFFAVYPFHTDNGVSINETVELTRPFAQINFGATTYETSLNLVNNGKIKVESTAVTVTKIASSFNTLTGEGEGETAVTFEAAATPNLDEDQKTKLLSVGNDTYFWLGMNYLIVTGNSDNVKVDMTFNTNMGVVTHSVENVPVKENYRTNILGNLLTTDAKFEVVVDERFEGTYFGEPFVELPPYDDATSTYSISTPEQLLYVALGGESFDGQVVKLADDIDLSGEEWTPAGTAEAPFKGTFDGNNKKITGLSIDADYAAMFAYTAEGVTIKDLTLENVDINSSKYAAALVCCAEKNLTVENVTVSGNINATSYAAGIVLMNNDDDDAVVIRNCVNNATVTSKRASGIAAWVTGGTVIENVVNNGNVTGTINANGIVNRIAGTVNNAVNYGTIIGEGTEASSGIASVLSGTTTFSYCFNYGDVTTKADNPNSSAAGILGQTPSAAVTLSYCANYGDITAEQSYAAGIAYSLYGNVKANYCYNEGEVSGADGAGAIAPKAQYGTGDKATCCLNAGVVTSAKGSVYQGSYKNESCYYYNGNDLFAVADGSVADAAVALAVLNGGADADFFVVDGGKIVVDNN